MKRIPRIETDTPLIPAGVARSVREEVGVWLGEPLPQRWVRELAARANTVYAHNAQFRRYIRGKGTRGRDWLWVFMRHWLADLLGEQRPLLYARLPSSYASGHPLPEKNSAPNAKSPPRTRKTPRRLMTSTA